ncbi:MAG: 3-methyl-2-oxobutanoate hydroxymethyltransferase, partial [Candidatus Omnitrophica bacterium]|nr:3-methyl-2-oxobutanoate hydroxymethyltransferase [Candidatus Omnitrophota bacterium]
EIITKKISIPTIGIGAGIHCDGQVLVINDMLGLFDRYTPKFVKKYIELSPVILKVIQEYKDEVINGEFPGIEHTFKIKEEELKKICEETK